MKKSFIFFVSILLSAMSFAQTDSAYQKTPYIPPFHIQLADSTWFNKTNLPKKETLVLYFSPDCGHCQIETEELISHMKLLNNLQVVMITSRPYEDMKRFSDHYLLQKFPAIKIGSDTDKVVTRFYDVKFTPFSALYDKRGKLVKVYESGIDFDDLASKLN